MGEGLLTGPGDLQARLVARYTTARAQGETALAVFRCVDLRRVRAPPADLDALTAEDALPPDFIDPGEEMGFEAETRKERVWSRGATVADSG
jgi:hypothetical protein